MTVWLQIQQAVSNQILNIKAEATQERMRTPLNLDQAQYHACFGYITTTALRLAHSNFLCTARPLKPCTGVFKATTGLPVYTELTISDMLKSPYILVIFMDIGIGIGIQA